MNRRIARTRAFTLVELLVTVVIIATLISILLPALSRVRSEAQRAKLAPPLANGGAAAPSAPMISVRHYDADAESATQPARPAPPPTPLALVKSFSAKVDLTPRLSVGTAEPESIYEAKFTANLTASAPPSFSRDPKGSAPETCEIRLPLPPQIISLADLSVTVNHEPSDNVTLRDGALVWAGPLPTTPTPIEITYAAVGKGLYELQTPPGRILDTFTLDLTAVGSDIRMLELSLQPTRTLRAAEKTTYSWNYQRLMFGRPISIDVLGVAPVDRLGELRWLGPLSVCVFGLIVGLYAHAHDLARFDRWMLLLTLGAFTGAYPLMYFAQEFIPLQTAIVGSASIAILIITLRALTVIGLRHTALGVLLPAAASMALTLIIATHANLQGILLTAGGILVFIVAMILMPRIHWPTPKPRVLLTPS